MTSENREIVDKVLKLIGKRTYEIIQEYEKSLGSELDINSDTELDILKMIILSSVNINFEILENGIREYHNVK